MSAYRIFIVEDDEAIAGAVENGLRGWGMEAARAADFRNVVQECLAFQPHLVLMDVMLPCFDGYHWCAELRRHSRVPVVFLSSASDNMNQMMALNLGADDFIAKPFDFSLLMAKVRALLRRAYDFSPNMDVVLCGKVALNRADGTAAVDGEKLSLTRTEYRILLELLENRGRVVPRDALMERIWETDDFIDDNTLTVNVARLRRKLEAAGAGDLIETRKGVGYLIE